MSIQDSKSIHVRETIYQSVVNNVLLFRPETIDDRGWRFIFLQMYDFMEC